MCGDRPALAYMLGTLLGAGHAHHIPEDDNMTPGPTQWCGAEAASGGVGATCLSEEPRGLPRPPRGDTSAALSSSSTISCTQSPSQDLSQNAR